MDVSMQGGFAKKSERNYIHWTATWINIVTTFIDSEINTLLIVDKKDNKRYKPYAQQSLDGLGLFDGSKPNDCLVEFFNAFCKAYFDYIYETKGLNQKSQGELEGLNERDVEDILNYRDENAALRTVSRELKERIMDNSLVEKLKKHYRYQCQICGKKFDQVYGVDFAEGHHIEHFVKSKNNNASNIIILCPDHHRMMHKATPVAFNRATLTFTYPNGCKEIIKINHHL
jgi:5-methylcytosine-specific restriction endonuclease McrA